MGSRQAQVVTLSRSQRPGSIRQARQRERQARGAIVLQVEIVEHEVASAAIASGVLTEAEALQRDALRTTIEDLVRRWCREWTEAPTGSAKPGARATGAMK